MAKIAHLEKWLGSSVTRAPGGTYRHRVLKEDATRWPHVQARIKQYFRSAHSDAVRRLRRLATGSLHPLKKKRASQDVADRYPHTLEMTTLKGYFGEVMSSAVAEAFDVCGHNDWKVPGFLFRVHIAAFQKLEAQRQLGGAVGTVFGRTGDDSLAFRRDPSSGAIIGVLYCEAKCTADHDSSMVSDAHEKLNGPGPLDVLSLIEVLLDDPNPESVEWVDALRTFRDNQASGTIQRYNAAYYICGRHPASKSTWMDPAVPHASYRSPGRVLESVEVHLTDVETNIRAIYSPEGWR